MPARRSATGLHLLLTLVLILCFLPHWPSGVVLPRAGPPARHLVVLQHGLSGTSGDLRLLGEEILRRTGDRALVHPAKASMGNNLDGVSAGGRRLAEEIREVVARHPSLKQISVVGNSLGGLYARFAVAELLDDRKGTLAGLEPVAFVTIGCPHLGVRRFTFLPLPSLVQGAAGILVGQTGEDLMLRDKESLLLRMADPQSRFIAALRSFDRRALFANLWGDFMVPFGTAALEPSWGAGIGDENRADKFMKRPGVVVLDKSVLQKERNGIAARLRVPASERAADAAADPATPEAVMASNLEACGWTKYAVAFRSTGTLFPMAHNKISALRRSDWRKYAFSWFEGSTDGDVVVEHIADYIVDPSLVVT